MKSILMRIYVRSIIDKYNKRIAKHLESYMGWPADEVLTIINLMDDNREAFLKDNDEL